MEAKIKPQDLRQGNLLQDKDSKRIGYVISMTGNRIRCKMSHSKLNQHISEWEPIPLSEDWLERMGYINNGQNIFDHPEGFFSVRLMYGKATTLGRDIKTLELKGVHHLQNLVYDLYEGSELTIKDINNIEVK